MAVDILQEKIRKLKNPTVLEFPAPGVLPAQLLAQEGNIAAAYGRFCRELLQALKGSIGAARFSFASFALLGAAGLDQLQQSLRFATDLGYYVLLDAPEILSPAGAAYAARSLLEEDSAFACQGVVIGSYLGSDVIKPFLPYCKAGKDVFAVVRTANKSAPEVQDLLTGSRQVHAAAADLVSRYGADTAGKSGYSRVGVVAAASSADSLRSLRSKYPKLFLLVDGYEYPNANAKNCSFAFDKFGHGAAVCSGALIADAWQQTQSQGEDYLELAAAAAERMKKNLCRYVNVL